MAQRFVADFTSPNRTVYASPPVGGSGYGFARSIASLIPTQNLRHSLSALEMLRISLYGPPNRRKQPERYVQLRLNFSEILKWTIDKKEYCRYYFYVTVHSLFVFSVEIF
jgi:hypothetical protein